MRDSQQGGRGDQVGSGLAVLARKAVASLIAGEGGSGRIVDSDTVASLARMLVEDHPGWRDTVRQELRRVRVGETELVDSYFPEIACQLGRAWVDDSAPFADVTVGVARMQAMLRDIGRDWTSNTAGGHAAATVLVVLPEGEQHSFGAVLMTGQLRRQGVSVRLEIGTKPDALGRLVRERNFDCAMISVGCEEKLDQCKRLVDSLKHASGGCLPVAVGGAVLDRQIDIRDRTAADFVTRDPVKAMHRALAGQTKIMEAVG